MDFGLDPLTANHCSDSAQQPFYNLVEQKCKIDDESDTTPAAVSEADLQNSPIHRDSINGSSGLPNRQDVDSDAAGDETLSAQNGDKLEDLPQGLFSIISRVTEDGHSKKSDLIITCFLSFLFSLVFCFREIFYERL